MIPRLHSLSRLARRLRPLTIPLGWCSTPTGKPPMATQAAWTGFGRAILVTGLLALLSILDMPLYNPAVATAGLISNINVSAGATSNNLSAVTFSNSNGVSFGLTGSVVTAIVGTNYAGVGETVGTVAGTDVAVTMDANGLSLVYPKYITTYVNDLTSGRAGVGETVGTTAGSDLAMTVDTDGVSIGYPKWLTTAALSGDTSKYVQAWELAGNTAGTTSSAPGTKLYFAGGNNITVSGNGNTITISAANETQTVPPIATVVKEVQSAGSTGTITRFAPEDHAHRGVNLIQISGNTLNTSNVIYGSVYLAGGNNITLSQVSAAGAATITISAAAGGGAVVSNAIQQVSSATGSGTNTSRFAADDHVHAGVYYCGVSNDAGNTAGDTRVSFGRFVLRGGNNITLSQITAANELNTIVVSAGAGGAGVGGFGASNTGNTAGNTGTSTGTWVLAGTTNITVSESTGAAGVHTLWLSAPNAAGGAAPTLSIWDNLPMPAISGSIQLTNLAVSNGTLWLFPLHQMNVGYFPGNMTASTVMIQMSNNSSSNNTAAQTQRYSFIIYTRANATSLNTIFSASTSWTNGATSQSSLIHGVRWLTFHSSQFNVAPTFSQTEYYGALLGFSSGASRSQAWFGARVGHSVNLSGTVGAASASANSRGDIPWLGFRTVSFTTAVPAGLAMADVAHTGSGYGMAIPHIVFNNLANAY